MPLYEYQCTNCEKRFEELVNNIEDEGDLACPACQSTKIFKVMSEFAVGSSSGGGRDPEPIPPCAVGGGGGGCGGCGGRGHH